MKRKTNLIQLFAFSLFFIIMAEGIHPAYSAGSSSETSSIIQSERPQVEVMFVLDTTGSMGGLIAAAKEKIWSIANTLGSADPAPEIRMGLVGYRDRGDAYVTTFASLSDDLDAVYTRLMKFQADGGGDTPESVNQALFEAVSKTDWSDNSDTYRVIFLVGDAPPQMNYRNDVKYAKSCRMAVQRDIIINTIQCGSIPETAPIWREIAQMGHGAYFRVSQSGSAVLYKTPYDKKIGDLSRSLDGTRIYYGSPEALEKMKERKKTADEIYSVAAPSAVAKRTIFNSKKAGAKNFLGSQELVHAVESGTVDLEKMDKDELPPELRKMNKAELERFIADQSKQRKALQGEIEKLAKKRQAYIEEKLKNERNRGADSLDAQIYKCIQTQAAQKDIGYTGGPEY